MWEVRLFYKFQIIQAVGVVFLNFVQYYKYQGHWLRNVCMPYIHVLLTVILFFLIPVAALVIFTISVFKIKIWGTQMGIWMMTYMFTCIFVAGWFYKIILGVIGDLKEQYYEDMRLDEEEEKATRKKELKNSQVVVNPKNSSQEPLIVQHNLD